LRCSEDGAGICNGLVVLLLAGAVVLGALHVRGSDGVAQSDAVVLAHALLQVVEAATGLPLVPAELFGRLPRSLLAALQERRRCRAPRRVHTRRGRYAM
jgi:hypothetical protein